LGINAKLRPPYRSAPSPTPTSQPATNGARPTPTYHTSRDHPDLFCPPHTFKMSSEAYERERQNNSRLDELAGKVTALRGVTVDIYENARDHSLIQSNTEHFTNMGVSIKNSSTRLARMAQSGNKVAILKLAGMISGVVILLWWIGGWIFSGSGKGGEVPPA